MSLRNRIKHVSRHPKVRAGLGKLTSSYIRWVKATSRWSTINAAGAEPAWRGEAPIIVAFWHNRLALMPYCWQSSEPFHMLISGHPDGQLIARAVGAFGIKTIAGSSTRGGGGAVRDNANLNAMVATNTALGRAGVPDDIGGVVASLLSPDNRWINAQRIEASGGMFL